MKLDYTELGQCSLLIKEFSFLPTAGVFDKSVLEKSFKKSAGVGISL